MSNDKWHRGWSEAEGWWIPVVIVFVALAAALVLSGCASETTLAPTPTPVLLPEKEYALFFFWRPECPYCQMMLEDINRIREGGYFDVLMVQLVGFQVGVEPLVENIGFWNLAGELPRGALGTPYLVLWDHTVSPPREVLHFYYMPVDMWTGLLQAVLQ